MPDHLDEQPQEGIDVVVSIPVPIVAVIIALSFSFPFIKNPPIVGPTVDESRVSLSITLVDEPVVGPANYTSMVIGNGPVSISVVEESRVRFRFCHGNCCQCNLREYTNLYFQLEI